MNNYRTIGKYKMSNICLESYPCQHIIEFENGEKKLMFGDKIYCLFNSEGLSDPHIDHYAEWVKKRNYFNQKNNKCKQDKI